MSTWSGILAEKIPSIQEPGRLQSCDHKKSDSTDQLSTRKQHVHVSLGSHPSQDPYCTS